MATISDEGALRAASAALCANGGFAVILRMPGLAISGSDAEQLGLGVPEFQDVPIGLAVWRKVGNDRALLLGAIEVDSLMGSQGFASAKSLFEAAVGVSVSGVQYVIKKCEPVLVAGVACAYRLTVEEPIWA